MMSDRVFEPCRFGVRVSTCYHVPRCHHEVPGNRTTTFGHYLGGRMERPDKAQVAAYNARVVRTMIRHRGLEQEIRAEARQWIISALLADR